MTVYKRGKKDVYRYDFYEAGRRYTGRIGPVSLDQAKRAEAVVRGQLIDKRMVSTFGITRSRLSVRAFYESEFEPEIKADLQPGTWRAGRGILRRFMILAGGVRLRDVGIDILDAHKIRRLKTVSPTMVRTDFKWLTKFFESARRRGYLAINPARGYPLPREASPPDRIVEEDEEDRLFAAIKRPVVRNMIQFMLWTGMRRIEVVQLQWKDVNFGQRHVVVQAKTPVVSRLPLVDEAIEILKEIGPGEREAFVFLNARRRPFAPNSLWWNFALARRKAKLQDVRLHDLRHTVATRLARAGQDLATVGAILRHRPPYHSTLRYFAHVNEGRLREALKGLVRPRHTRSPNAPENGNKDGKIQAT